MIRAVVFDFDGVLCESAEVKTRAFRELFSQHSEHLEEIVALHEREAGRSRFWKFQVIYANILQRPLTEQESQSLGLRFSELVLQAVLDAPLVAGVEDFLAANVGRKLFIASGTPEPELRQIVEARGLQGYFEGVYGSPRGKGEIVREILQAHQLSAHEVLFVGDARTDQEGAREAGVFFLGRTPPGQVPPWEAARYLEDLCELSAEVARFDRAAPISVVLCTRNGCSRGYLYEALDSVLDQTVYPEEVLVIDDGSTDGTPELLARRYPGLRILSQANQGLAAARNTAIRATTSAYLAFLDDDDRWEPDKLARQWERQAPAVFTGLCLIDERGHKLGERRPASPRLTWPEILLGNQVTGPSSVLLARWVLRQVGEFQAGLGGTEDYDYWIRCARFTDFEAIDRPLVGYRVHHAQMSAGYAAMASQALEVADRHARLLGPDGRRLACRYNAYGTMLMGLGRGHREAVRLGWGWARRQSWDLGLLLIRMVGMALSPWPGLQRRWRRSELRWVGKRLRRLARA